MVAQALPNITRDCSLLQAVLKLDHEQVHHVDEIQHQVWETRKRLTQAICNYAKVRLIYMYLCLLHPGIDSM